MNNLKTIITAYIKHFHKIEQNFIQNISALWLFVRNNELLNLNYAPSYLPVGDVEEEYNVFDDHILWAVPKHRRTIENRRSRRIGAENYFCKLIPRKKLLTCYNCGGPYEFGRLCPNCYGKVKKVTEKIKEAMLEAQKLDPVEHEYLPVFSGEKVDSKDGFYKGMRIVEIPENRPTWFSKKLTQKSAVTISDERTFAHPNPLHIKK